MIVDLRSPQGKKKVYYVKMSQNTEKTEETSNIPLEQVPLENLTITVNVLYAFLNRANKRGAFGLQESAKVMQCLALLGSVAKSIDDENATSNPVKLEPSENKPDTTTKQQQGVRKKS